MDNVKIKDLNIEAVNAELSDNIIGDLKLPAGKRAGFKFNSYTVTIPRYFYRIIGVKDNEQNYYDFLYRLDREMQLFSKAYKRFDKGMDKDISIDFQNKINHIWELANRSGELDTSVLISEMDICGMFPRLENHSLVSQIKNYFKVMIDYSIKSGIIGDMGKIRPAVNYSMFWINKYFNDIFHSFDYDGTNPKIIYFGQISTEEAFFLVFLSMLGCDILYFNPENSGSIADIDKMNVFSKEIHYISRFQPKEFPTEASDRIKTSAYNAREELNKNLFDDQGSFYRPWQFADYSVQSLTMKTTYEEVNLWIREKAMIRDGWKVEQKQVFIPNIFAKVSGVHEDIDRYWKEINEIVNAKKSMLINKLPIVEIVPLEYGKYQQVFPEGYKTEFNIDKLLTSSWWRYKELRMGLQRAMAEKIKELCLKPPVLNKDNQELRDIQVDIFSVLVNLDMDLLQLLQGFDYPEDVPKIVIYNNEKNGNISYEDSILLAFMNSMGIDIVIYNPSGYTDIETYLYPDCFDIHHLEKVAFNLEFQKYVEKKKGFFKNLFKF